METKNHPELTEERLEKLARHVDHMAEVLRRDDFFRTPSDTYYGALDMVVDDRHEYVRLPYEVPRATVEAALEDHMGFHGTPFTPADPQPVTE